MRRVRYSVAASLDGFIAGPNGEHDWIPMDPDIDFQALFAEFDTLLMGRKTFEVARHQDWMPGMAIYVVSRTLKQSEHPDVTVLSDGLAETVRQLKEQPGKDIWLFGGGSLFRGLAECGLVDSVEVALVPVLLGGGVPVIAPALKHVKLELREQKLYSKSGIIALTYGAR
jgi:dihydrofolate reductase